MGYSAKTFRKEASGKTLLKKQGQERHLGRTAKQQVQINYERGDHMENKFIRVDEVAKELEVSQPYAYKLIRKLNEELKSKGFITISGRVNRQYFNERLYGAEKEEI